MERNVAGQPLQLLALDPDTGPVSGDAANLTAYVSIDGGARTALNDASATEVHATDAKGVYQWTLTAAETNGKTLSFTGKSSTSGVEVVPLLNVATTPTNYSTSDLSDIGGELEVDDAAAAKIAAKVNASRSEFYPNRSQVWVLQRGSAGIVVQDSKIISKGASEDLMCWIDFAPILGRNEAVEEINSLVVSGSTFASEEESKGLLGNLAYLTITDGESEQTGDVDFDVTTTEGQRFTGTTQIRVP